MCAAGADPDPVRHAHLCPLSPLRPLRPRSCPGPPRRPAATPRWDARPPDLQRPHRPAPGRGRAPGRRARRHRRRPLRPRARLRGSPPRRPATTPAPLGSLEGTSCSRPSRLDGVDDRRRRAARPRRRRRPLGATSSPRLSELGLAALHGSSPDVSIAGYSLGGGMGWLARKHGLQTNSVTAIELVTADGELVRADADARARAVLGAARRRRQLRRRHRDRVRRSTRSRERLRRRALLPVRARGRGAARLARVAARAARRGHLGRPQLLQLPAAPGSPRAAARQSFAIVEAAFLGGEAEARELLAPLRALGPAMDTFAMVPPAELGDLHMDPREPLPYRQRPRAARRAARRRHRRARRRGRPRLGLAARAGRSSATSAARSPGARRAPARGRRCPAS